MEDIFLVQKINSSFMSRDFYYIFNSAHMD